MGGIVMDTEALWNSFLNAIKESISSLSYETWFKDTMLVSLKNKVATVIVPMTMHKEHLVKHYQDIIDEKFTQISGSACNFEYLLEEEWDVKKDDILIDDFVENTPNDNKMEKVTKKKKKAFSNANLNKDYTFDSFIVGPSNRFAFTASMAVAEKPGKAYNPLFLYGKSGLGKTHLMHSIGNYIVENTDLKVLYISSDKFVDDFINAVVRSNDKGNFDKIDNFKSKYRDIDVLMIDDIQFLGNATKGQVEFFHTFNELYDENKQIVIASDRSVDDLKTLENRLLTRFHWGLTANITPPDFDLRMSIIERKIAHQESARDVPRDVIEYIANNFASDVRQLEGAITRVFAYALMMNKGSVDLDTAIDALKDQLTDRSVYKNDVHRIQTVVCDYFKITLDDIKGKKRSQNINYPRQVAIYLCRTLANESFPKIGTYFGGRDHSTIMSSYRKIEDDLKENEQLKVVIKELKNMLSN